MFDMHLKLNARIPSLQLLLFEAERAWAYAQDLIAQSTLPANDVRAGTLRHSATGRLRRAVHWSTQLLSHCQALYAAGRFPSEHVVQATVYTLVMNGRFLRYRDDFEDALVQLSVARDLLDQLAERAVTSRDQALATLFADEIGPEIRYCAHELGREKAYDVDAIVVELGRKHRGEIVDGCEAILRKLKQEGEGSGEARKKLETPMWEGQPIPVRNPELVDVLLRVQEAEAKIAAPREAAENIGTGDKRKQKKRLGSKKGVAAYDAILSALSDAEEISRKLMEAQQACASVSSLGILLTSLQTEHEQHWSICRQHPGHPVRSCLHYIPVAIAPDSARLATHFDSTQFSSAIRTRRRIKGEGARGQQAISCCCQALGDGRAKPDTNTKLEHRGRESRSGFYG